MTDASKMEWVNVNDTVVMLCDVASTANLARLVCTEGKWHLHDVYGRLHSAEVYAIAAKLEELNRVPCERCGDLGFVVHQDMASPRCSLTTCSACNKFRSWSTAADDAVRAAHGKFVKFEVK